MTNRFDTTRRTRPGTPYAAPNPRMAAMPARTQVASPRSPVPVPRTPQVGPASGGECSSPSTLSLPSPERGGSVRLGSPLSVAAASEDARPSPWNEDVRRVEAPRGRGRRLTVHPAVLVARARAETTALRDFVDGWLEHFAGRWPARRDALAFTERLGASSATLMMLQHSLERPSGRLHATTAPEAVCRVAAEEAEAVTPVGSKAAELRRAQLVHVAQPMGLGLFDLPGMPLALPPPHLRRPRRCRPRRAPRPCGAAREPQRPAGRRLRRGAAPGWGARPGAAQRRRRLSGVGGLPRGAQDLRPMQALGRPDDASGPALDPATQAWTPQAAGGRTAGP